MADLGGFLAKIFSYDAATSDPPRLITRQVETVAGKLVTGSFFKKVSQSSSQPMSHVHGIEQGMWTRRLSWFKFYLQKGILYFT